MSKESAYFILDTVNGKRDLKELKEEMDSFRGVISVSVNPEKNSLSVDYDNTGVNAARLEKRLEDLGYEISSHKTEEHVM